MNEGTSFLDGFAAGSSLGAAEADEQWTGFSRQLSDHERARIEAGGFAAGEVEGRRWRDQFGQG